jgi:hypothetical protein
MVSVLSASLSEFAETQLKQAQDVYQVKQIQRHLNAFSTAHLGKEKVNELFIASLNADIISYEVNNFFFFTVTYRKTTYLVHSTKVHNIIVVHVPYSQVTMGFY